MPEQETITPPAPVLPHPCVPIRTRPKTALDGLSCLSADARGPTAQERTAWMVASQTGHLDAVVDLIGHGADVNASSPDGYVALMGAAFRGHEQLVVTLLANGAAVDKRPDNGKSALHRAALRDRTAIIEHLIAAGVPAGLHP